jgi:hypothetical protein
MIDDIAAESLFVGIGADLAWHTLVFFLDPPPKGVTLLFIESEWGAYIVVYRA